MMVERPTDLRGSLRTVTLAWAFGAAWLYATTGAALTRYAKLLGMPEFGFGLLAALPFVGALVQLPVSYFIERYGQRKRLFVIAGVVHRLMWLGVAAIPWLVPDAWWWIGLLGLMTISSVAGHAAVPGVLSWLADLVPSRIRGRYFSRRIQVGQLVGLAVTVAIGQAMDAAEVVSPAVLRRTVSLILGASALFGALDFLILWRVPERQAHLPDLGFSLGQLLRQPLADANFRCYLGYSGTMTFSLGYVGQFIWLYVFDVLEMSNRQANALLVALPLLISLLTFPLWGRLTDRLGRRPVLIIAGLCVVHGAAIWVFVTRETWWLGYLPVVLATAAWPGVEIASFNLLLEIAESKGRLPGGEGQPPSTQTRASAYIAVNSVVVAVAGTLSGVFGGALASGLAHWRGTILGWPLTYHGLLFLISAALRVVALAWILNIDEPGAHTTRAAFRYMRANIYSNLQQAIFMPLRRIGLLARRTYRLTPAAWFGFRAARPSEDT